MSACVPQSQQERYCYRCIDSSHFSHSSGCSRYAPVLPCGGVQNHGNELCVIELRSPQAPPELSAPRRVPSSPSINYVCPFPTHDSLPIGIHSESQTPRAIAWSDIPSAPSILRRWSHVHSVIPGEPFVIARSRGSSQHAACAPAGQPPRPSFVPLAPAPNLQPTHSPVNAVAPATCKCASSGLHYHLRQNCWSALITTRPY